MKIKDIVEFLLFGFGFAGLIVLAAALEATPVGPLLWIFVGLAVLLWAVWLGLVLRERKLDNEPLATLPRLYVSDGEKWVAMDGSGDTKPFLTRKERNELFDQEDYDASR